MVVRPADDRGRVVPGESTVGGVKREQPVAALRRQARHFREREEHRLTVRQNRDLRIAAIGERELVAAPRRSAVARRERDAALPGVDLVGRSAGWNDEGTG